MRTYAVMAAVTVAFVVAYLAAVPDPPPPLTPGQAAHARECASKWAAGWASNPSTVGTQCAKAARKLVPATEADR